VQVYLPYFKGKVVFCSQKVEKLAKSMGFDIGSKTYVIDVGIQDDLNKVRKTASDYDMTAVEEIMNKSPINDAVIKHWQEKAGNRKTIIFCSTVEHAKSVAKSFDDHNIKAVVIHGGLSERERKATLVEYEQGDTNVIINVAVLTEGYDYQPTSCVILNYLSTAENARYV
jgi:superfamily II DNA or RNA helicase